MNIKFRKDRDCERPKAYAMKRERDTDLLMRGLERQEGELLESCGGLP